MTQLEDLNRKFRQMIEAKQDGQEMIAWKAYLDTVTRLNVVNVSLPEKDLIEHLEIIKIEYLKSIQVEYNVNKTGTIIQQIKATGLLVHKAKMKSFKPLPEQDDVDASKHDQDNRDPSEQTTKEKITMFEAMINAQNALNKVDPSSDYGSTKKEWQQNAENRTSEPEHTSSNTESENQNNQSKLIIH